MLKKAFNYALILLLLLCCAASRAGAQEERRGQEGAAPENSCSDGTFTGDGGEFKLARVVGGPRERAYFYGDGEGCPGPAAKCRQRAYVTPGDEVVVSRTFGDWVCSWYQPARGRETVGWIQAQRLEVSGADGATQPASWLGAWEFYDASLRVSRGARPGALRVSGEAFWRGANPENVHTGEFSGEAVPAGNVLTIGDDVCRVTLRLVGAYLVVGDNKQCGGVNVTFDGVYRRRRK